MFDCLTNIQVQKTRGNGQDPKREHRHPHLFFHAALEDIFSCSLGLPPSSKSSLTIKPKRLLKHGWEGNRVDEFVNASFLKAFHILGELVGHPQLMKFTGQP